MIAREHPLRGIRILIEGAKENIEKLDAFIGGLDCFDYGSIKREPNKKPDQFNFVFRVDREFPGEITAMAGAIIRDLDAVLDNLICALYREKVPSGSCSGLEFPIKGTADEFNIALKERKIRKLGPKAIDVLRSVNSHKAGHKVFWILRKLSREYKHRLPIQMGAAIVPASGLYIKGENAEVIINQINLGGKSVWPKIVKDGDVIITTDAKSNVEFHGSLSVSLGKSDFFKNEVGLKNGLLAFIDVVETTVGLFAGEFPPE